jgi:hypothetical protein
MAAARDANIRSVLIGFGPLVSAFEEDRWGYVSALKQRGFEHAIPEADRINAVLSDIIDRRQNRWADLSKALGEARDKPWFEALKDSNSILGDIAHSALPLWAQRVKFWWFLRMSTYRRSAPISARTACRTPVTAMTLQPVT